jgi:heat shock protein 4
MAVSVDLLKRVASAYLKSVVGIDLGNLASKIGVARHRGIDIITNEVSNRQTP